MLDMVRTVAEWGVATMEILGISAIAFFTIYALLITPVVLLRQKKSEQIFREVRQRLGRGILLGLEFLIAADIIHTVAIDMTMETVSMLAIIVVIRTFLSFTMEVELTGRWPWQAAAAADQTARGRDDR